MSATLIERLGASDDVREHDLEVEIAQALGYEVAHHTNGWRQRFPGERWQALARPLWSMETALRMLRAHASLWSAELQIAPQMCGPQIVSTQRNVCVLYSRYHTRWTLHHFAPTPNRALCAALIEARAIEAES